MQLVNKLGKVVNNQAGKSPKNIMTGTNVVFRMRRDRPVADIWTAYLNRFQLLDRFDARISSAWDDRIGVSAKGEG